jgi:hypothetical protein
MNPYVQGVVQPQIRELGEARRQAAIQAGEQATSAGAFGDARQGVADSLTNKAYMNAVGDVTGRGYSDAFNQAMAARTGDIGRLQQTRQFNAANNMAAQQFNAANELQARQFNAANEFAARQFNAGNLFQASQLNAQLREAMLGRQLAGGQAGMEYGLQQSQDRLQRLNAMMNVGQLQQQRGQQIRDADYENYLRGVEWPFRQWDMMLSMLTGQPNAQTVSQTQRGGNDLWGFLGTILGTAAGSAARGGFGA